MIMEIPVTPIELLIYGWIGVLAVLVLVGTWLAHRRRKQ